MKKLYLILFGAFSINCYGQTYKQKNFEETVHGLTTIINILKPRSSDLVYNSFGTGFFFHQYNDSIRDPDSCYNAINTSLKGIWLITNKHVLFGSENFKKLSPPFPTAIEFYMRKRVKSLDRPLWDTIRLEEPELRLLTKLHTDTLTDVVAINVTKFVLPKLLKGDSLFYYGAVSKTNFPNENLPVTFNGFGIVLGQEVLSIGYPKNFYDRVNLFPTVKSGIVASKWKMNSYGNPYFLIDAKLFPGSSGSIIITKSVKYGESDGNSYFDYFNFLGVYSGQPFRTTKPIEIDEITIIKKETYDIGIVWYYNLIEEIINK